MAGDGAGANGIQASVIEALQPARIAGVSIDIDDTFSGTCTNSFDSLGDAVPLQEWLTLTTLAETDNGIFSGFQVWYSHFDDLINIGNEGQAILRGDQVFLFLLGDTANTTGVASW